MPIGKIRLRVLPAQPQPAAPKVAIRVRPPKPKLIPPENLVVRIKQPKLRPERIIVPPKQRTGGKQLTVLRYDNEGRYFVDEFVERSSTYAPGRDDRRHIRHVNCPKFQFEVALAVCHRYCSYPCHVHLEVIKEVGWYTASGRSQFVETEKAKARARKKKGGGDDGDDV